MIKILRKKLLFCMHVNLNQLRGINFCEVVSQDRDGFIAKIKLRNGKYIVVLDYKLIGLVDAYLLKPDINMDHYLEIHTYGLRYHKTFKRKLPKLCLEMPSLNEWNPSMALMDSYVPWAAEWIEFYELWQLTGIWYGGGVHPGIAKEEK